jgi:hypothetical protein
MMVLPTVDKSHPLEIFLFPQQGPMSIRGVIARVGEQEGGFRGVYNHNSSYPTWMGPHLWRILHERYNGDVRAFVKEMIDAHPGGWSSFGEIC